MPQDNPLIVLLVLIPLVAGLLSLPVVRNLYLCRVIGLISFTLMLGISLLLLVRIARGDGEVLVTQMASWPAPFGIPLVLDALSALLLATGAVVGLASYLHSFSMLRPDVEHRYYHPLIQLLMMGVNMCFMTGDLFNLFVAFEIMLLAAYSLLAIGITRIQMRQVYKYILINMFASAIFVMCAGFTYGMLGTLNIADLARIVIETRASGEGMPAAFTILALLLIFVFAVKGAMFPLWTWLPDTYYVAPISIGGLFGGLMTKVGVYCMMRVYTMVFAADAMTFSTIQPLLAVAAAVTMFLAVLGAVSQHRIRRLLSIHIISQVGYMAFGITVMTGAALAGCLFHIIHNMVVKCSLFLCCGVMEKHTGTDDLDKMGGLLKRDFLLGVLFFIAAMSLVGLPPLSGFFGKMVIIQSGWEHFWWLSVIGLLTGALTLLSMLKIFSYGFWSPTPTSQTPETEEHAQWVRRHLRPAYAGIIMLVLVSLAFGLCAEMVYEVASIAGEQLIDPRAYITAVLGDDAYARIDQLNVASQQLADAADASNIAQGH